MKMCVLNTCTCIVMLLLCTQASWSAEKPGVQPTTTRSHTINEDSTPWHRDPFAGKVKKHPTTINSKLNGYKTTAKVVHDEQIFLQGIMRSDNAYHALINGRVVKKGDTIGSVVIKQISRFQVVVQNGNNEKSVYDIYQGRIDKDRGKK